MNYLAHLHLGGDEPAQLLGSLYGDFVKGPLQGRWPAAIEQGIVLHRRIDVFTDAHPLVKRAKARFPEARRRYAGILVDVFFDHCLARDWQSYADIPLAGFTRQVYRVLSQEPQLPERLAHIAPYMCAQDWLGSYRDVAVLERVVQGMQRRLSKPQGLAGGYAELLDCYVGLSQDFVEFYPQLQQFVAQQRLSA